MAAIFHEIITDQHISVHGEKFGKDYVIVFSLGIKTRHRLFIEMVPADKETIQIIEDWCNKSQESSLPIIIAPKDLHIEDQCIRKGSSVSLRINGSLF